MSSSVPALFYPHLSITVDIIIIIYKYVWSLTWLMYLKQLTVKGNKYWYLFHTIRQGKKFLKKSMYLGAQCPGKKQLAEYQHHFYQKLFPPALKNVLVIYMQPVSDSEKDTLAYTTSLLRKYGFNYTLIERSKVTSVPPHTDLVMVIGGDGTFLRAAHFVTDQFMIGVNAHPKKKEGFLMPYTKHTITIALKRIMKSEFTYCRLVRLASTINTSIKPELALNELFIGHKKPYKISRLLLTTHGVTHAIKSSGIVIGTPAGYAAWLKSMGGKPMPLRAQKYQYVIREPYEGRLHHHYHTQEILTAHESITIRSLTPEAIVVIDSLSREYSFPLGSTITINVASSPLKYLCPLSQP